MQRLSQTVHRLADQIGYKSTLRLIRAFGGRRLYIPQRIDDEHPLQLTVGQAAARTLVATWGGSYIPVPDEQTALLDLRNRRIVAEHAAGAGVRALSRDYGLSPAMVRKVLDAAGARAAP